MYILTMDRRLNHIIFMQLGEWYLFCTFSYLEFIGKTMYIDASSTNTEAHNNAITFHSRVNPDLAYHLLYKVSTTGWCIDNNRNWKIPLRFGNLIFGCLTQNLTTVVFLTQNLSDCCLYPLSIMAPVQICNWTRYFLITSCIRLNTSN